MHLPFESGRKRYRIENIDVLAREPDAGTGEYSAALNHRGYWNDWMGDFLWAEHSLSPEDSPEVADCLWDDDDSLCSQGALWA